MGKKNIEGKRAGESWRAESWDTSTKVEALEGKEWKRAGESWRSENWGASTKTKPEGKERKLKMCVKGDKRDIILLVLILRHRITPPVPYIIITEIILSMSPDTYQELCRRNCNLRGLTEEQQYHWFAWWCKEIEKREIKKGGGRWVAAVNWEHERIEEIRACLRDGLQGRGPVFELVDEESVNRLKLGIGQKKELVKKNRDLKEKEERKRAEEDQTTLQADWCLKNDWRHGSVPDLTILKPKSVIGQRCYPFGDFLRPLDDDSWSWNSDFDMASTTSASYMHSSSSSLTTWSNSSTATSSTTPPWYFWYPYECSRAFKEINRFFMRKKLEKMNAAERDGRLVIPWMMTD
ncbi:hypothetical protein SBOR_7710 [Sclerotinia borealis F-4128]|uniref:Uncharacterized protein n=1 Tax=Sclerotinia borealis (strain F-4128) TaxID=1432307 RepID=W9C7T5_SCLBF|nr:hypothetical protein SBOR_7710 [Sclerotinia borealis F-4128]